MVSSFSEYFLIQCQPDFTRKSNQLTDLFPHFVWTILFVFCLSGASSIGSVSSKFLAAFSAAAGKKSLQRFDSEESDPEVIWRPLLFHWICLICFLHICCWMYDPLNLCIHWSVIQRCFDSGAAGMLGKNWRILLLKLFSPQLKEWKMLIMGLCLQDVFFVSQR